MTIHGLDNPKMHSTHNLVSISHKRETWFIFRDQFLNQILSDFSMKKDADTTFKRQQQIDEAKIIHEWDSKDREIELHMQTCTLISHLTKFSLETRLPKDM